MSISRRERYERFNQQSKIEEPDVPDEGAHVWQWFWSLSSRRQHGMNGPQPLTFSEIGSWSRMTGERLLREELTILTDMDDAYLEALAKEREDQHAANEKPQGK